MYNLTVAVNGKNTWHHNLGENSLLALMRDYLHRPGTTEVIFAVTMQTNITIRSRREQRGKG